ncbi:MAG: HAMP domain-containing histidine kinase [Eubacterium sp.]|nr:HAMP domain-containing histidine kinase [Eubacterium sp.]
MVLDTKWKRFKYSNANKLLCVLMACVMAAVFVANGFALIKCTAWFFNGEDMTNTDVRSFYSSYVFSYSMNRDISTIAEQVNHQSSIKAYNKAAEEYVEKALKLYRAEEKKNILTDEQIEGYIERLHKDYSIYDSEEGRYYSDHDDRFYLNSYYSIYIGDDGKYYHNDFDFDTLTTSDYDSGNMNFGHNDEKAREMLKKYFHDYNYYNYVSDTYYSRDLSNLKNISYYGENDDGSVFTNVKDSEAFINSIKNGEVDYIAFENGKLLLSNELEPLREQLWASGKSDCRIYLTVDTSFSGEDKYAPMFREYGRLAETDIMETITAMAIAFIAMIVFAVMSVRLAGNTADGIKTGAIDRVPQDLHLVVICGLVCLAGLAIFVLLESYGNIIQFGNYSDFEVKFFISDLFGATLVALVCGIYLLILEFVTSVARCIKAEKPIFKKTLIVTVIVLIFKLIKQLFKHGGKGIITVLKFIVVDIIGGFFKLIGKLFKLFWRVVRKVLHLFKLLALKPKRLEKKLVSATVWYTLFNFVFVLIIILYTAHYGYAYGGVPIITFLGAVALIAIDTYTVYRAVKYLKALDDIIDTSAKREPLPYDTATLPPSLRTLAESLEATNAELQEAVLKAVKDERTKAELITNVSHDLKTPLTSVINYIDLLQKCDIEDETAKQYMAVIEEKSARLKRLIEDLIEASKVSTGNVTLNKTKLNLSELASQAIVEETSDIEKNNLRIIFEEAQNKHIVFADGTKIYRVFENLLSNARKYSAPYTRIYASVYSDDSYGYFEIKNISKDALNISAEELTERFVRGDKSRSEEGNGLGLSIARELCKLNGGDLIITIDGDLFKATVKLPKEEN